MSSHSDHKIVLTVDGEEVQLEPNGDSKGYLKYKHAGEGKVLVSIYVPK